jgi:hypothetical protein
MSVIPAKKVCENISSLPSFEQMSVILAKNVCENLTSLLAKLYEQMSVILAKQHL